MDEKNVQFIWNFWPFEWFVWWPVKAVLNLFTLPFYLLLLGPQQLWNFVPDIYGMLLWLMILLGIPLTILAIIFCGLYIAFFTYIYVTSIPEIVIIDFLVVLGGGIAGFLYLLTEYSFDWETMPSSAWLK